MTRINPVTLQPDYNTAKPKDSSPKSLASHYITGIINFPMYVKLMNRYNPGSPIWSQSSLDAIDPSALSNDRWFNTLPGDGTQLTDDEIQGILDSPSTPEGGGSYPGNNAVGPGDIPEWEEPGKSWWEHLENFFRGGGDYKSIPPGILSQLLTIPGLDVAGRIDKTANPYGYSKGPGEGGPTSYWEELSNSKAILDQITDPNSAYRLANQGFADIDSYDMQTMPAHQDIAFNPYSEYNDDYRQMGDQASLEQQQNRAWDFAGSNYGKDYTQMGDQQAVADKHGMADNFGSTRFGQDYTAMGDQQAVADLHGMADNFGASRFGRDYTQAGDQQAVADMHQMADDFGGSRFGKDYAQISDTQAVKDMYDMAGDFGRSRFGQTYKNLDTGQTMHKLAFGDGLTPYQQERMDALNRQSDFSRQDIDTSSMQGLSQGKSHLAQSGGLSAGASERMAGSNALDNLYAKQGLTRDVLGKFDQIYADSAKDRQGYLDKVTQMDRQDQAYNLQNQRDTAKQLFGESRTDQDYNLQNQKTAAKELFGQTQGDLDYNLGKQFQSANKLFDTSRADQVYNLQNQKQSADELFATSREDQDYNLLNQLQDSRNLYNQGLTDYRNNQARRDESLDLLTQLGQKDIDRIHEYGSQDWRRQQALMDQVTNLGRQDQERAYQHDNLNRKYMTDRERWYFDNLLKEQQGNVGLNAQLRQKIIEYMMSQHRNEAILES